MRTRLVILAGPAFLIVSVFHSPAAQENNKDPDRLSISVRGHIKALRTGRFSERLDAAEALVNSGPAAREALPALIDALKYRHDLVPICAAQALGNMGPAAKSAVPALIANLRKDQVVLIEVRSSAAKALGEIGPVNEQVAPALLNALDDRSGEVRVAVAAALKKIGPADLRTVSVLSAALNSSTSAHRLAAAIALSQVGPAGKEGKAALISALGDRRWQVRRDAAAGLAESGPGSKDALPLLRTMLGDAHGEVRHAAALALQRVASATGSEYDLKAAHGALWLPRIVLGRHKTSITSLSFAAKAPRLATASADGIIKLWDLPDGSEVLSWLGHDRGPCSVALSPDGRLLASGGVEGTPELWDAGSGQQLGQLRGHRDAILCLTFSREGKVLASGSCDRTVRLWDMSSGKPLGSVGPVYPYNALALDPHRGLVAAEGASGAVRLWDGNTGNELAPLEGHSGPVSCLAFSADGRSLASSIGGALEDGAPEVRVWNLAAGTQLSGPQLEGGLGGQESSRATLAQDILDPSLGAVLSLALSPDGQILAVGAELAHKGWGQRPALVIWDVKSQTKLAALGEHRASITTIAFSPAGGLLASGSFDGTVQVWNISALLNGREYRMRPKAR